MNLKLFREDQTISGKIEISGSKSESNRLLILQALYPQLEIENLSGSDDTEVLRKALSSEEKKIDVHHAGTAMRFLTAYFASREGCEIELTGSKRMQERPISVLVDALRILGAEIEYSKKEGFPPLKIKGKKITQDQVTLKANISSQYISALMLIAPSLPNGLKIDLEGEITSEPYIKMTLSLLQEIGCSASFTQKQIRIHPKKNIDAKKITVESDWSSASYFYSIVALSREAEIAISSFKKNSLQGDSVLPEIYNQLGVKTEFSGENLLLKKHQVKKPKSLCIDLANSPDLAQTIAVTCLGLNIKCELTGLQTLKIKETDRLQALKNEIGKLGGKAEITSDSIRILPTGELRKDVKISTYQDHRMALAFAPLSVKTPSIIEESEVVSKSYPDFWKDLQKLHFSIKEI